jgi:hypothetical protein
MEIRQLPIFSGDVLQPWTRMWVPKRAMFRKALSMEELADVWPRGNEGAEIVGGPGDRRDVWVGGRGLCSLAPVLCDVSGVNCLGTGRRSKPARRLAHVSPSAACHV